MNIRSCTVILFLSATLNLLLIANLFFSDVDENTHLTSYEYKENKEIQEKVVPYSEVTVEYVPTTVKVKQQDKEKKSVSPALKKITKKPPVTSPVEIKDEENAHRTEIQTELSSQDLNGRFLLQIVSKGTVPIKQQNTKTIGMVFYVIENSQKTRLDLYIPEYIIRNAGDYQMQINDAKTGKSFKGDIYFLSPVQAGYTYLVGIEYGETGFYGHILEEKKIQFSHAKLIKEVQEKMPGMMKKQLEANQTQKSLKVDGTLKQLGNLEKFGKGQF